MGKPWEKYGKPWEKYKGERTKPITGSSGDIPEETLFNLPPKVEKAVFPTTSEKEGVGAAFLQGLEALGTPVRLAGKLRGYEASDPESALLRPEMEKIKSKLPEPSPTGGPLQTPNLLRGGVELAGNILSDPLSYASLVKKPIEKGAKGVAKRIEASLLKPKEKVLSKMPLDEITENVLKKRTLSTGKNITAAGTLKKSAKKIQTIFDDVEKQIDNVLDDAVKVNPDVKVNVDDIINRVKQRINEEGIPGSGDELFAAMREEAASKLQKWSKEFTVQSSDYATTGNVPLKDAQKLKRLLNKTKKAFKKGAPSVDTAPEETVIDVLYLELKDAIEKKVPAIKELNQVYKELIPVQQAVEDAMSKEGKKDIIGIVSSLAGGIGGTQLLTPGKFGVEDILAGLGAAGLYKASRSGRTAQLLGGMSGLLKKAPDIIPPVSGGASAVSQIGRTRGIGTKKEEEEKKKKKFY